MDYGSKTMTDGNLPKCIDAARYRSPDFFQLEKENIFQKAWLVVGSTGKLQTAGEYMTADILGRGIVVVRQADGRLRAFYNSCLHRGTKIVDGCGHAAEFQCPYHGWRYGLDGKVTDIPGREGLSIPPEIEPLKLSEIAVAEALGLAWVNFSDAPPALLPSLQEIPAELEAYRLHEMRPIQERTWELNCNWKAVLENATESYHIPSVHPWSIASNVSEAPDFQAYGDHARLTLAIAPYGWRRFVDKLTSRGGPYTLRQMDALQKYLIFPNTLINVIPCHLTVFQTWPVAPDRCLFFYGFYGRKGAWPLEWLRARVSWLFSRWVLQEDMRILHRFQSGADNDHAGRHWFHQGEIANAHLHGAITRWLDREGK